VTEKHPNSDALSRIAWHPAFVEALALELKAHLDILEFHPEHQLTAEPLRIDCVIVKKAKGAVIEKNIAAIFKGTNLLEYKSPGDHVSVGSFYKVYGYACLYASLRDTPVEDMTVSFVASSRPRELVKHLRDARGYAVEERRPGIYTVTGDIFPMQLVDVRKLPEEENLWLKCLSDRLEPLAARKVIHAAGSQGKGLNMGAYLAAIFQANAMAIREAMKMTETVMTFEDVLEEAGLIAKWEARGETRGEARGEARGKAEGEARGKIEGRERTTLEIAGNLIALGLPVETIVSATKLDAETVRGLGARQAPGPSAP